MFYSLNDIGTNLFQTLWGSDLPRFLSLTFIFLPSISASPHSFSPLRSLPRSSPFNWWSEEPPANFAFAAFYATQKPKTANPKTQNPIKLKKIQLNSRDTARDWGPSSPKVCNGLWDQCGRMLMSDALPVKALKLTQLISENHARAHPFSIHCNRLLREGSILLSYAGTQMPNIVAQIRQLF